MQKINTKNENKTINYQGGILMVRSKEKIVKDFLNILYGKSQGEGHLVLWTKQDKRSYFFTQNKFDEASKKAICLSKDMDVYYGIGLQMEELTDGSRGGEDTVISLPGLWLDIDIKGSNHVSENLPPNRESVKQLLDLFHLKPSLVVGTGGGYHIYWLFKAPMILNDEKDRETAKYLSTTFQTVFQNFAAQKGWRIDSTADLSRLLRLPGTYNHKNGDKVPVELQIHIDSSRYDPTELASALTKYEQG